jgi:DNA-binding SARP family transcriptional activator
MTLYLQTGNRTAAVQTFQECVEALRRDLEMPPMPETLELYRRILEHV